MSGIAHGRASLGEPRTAADIARETVLAIPDPISGTVRFVDEYNPHETIDTTAVLNLGDCR